MLLRRFLSRPWFARSAAPVAEIGPPADATAAPANAERLAALGLVAAQAAHDLNNALSLLTAQLERLERRLVDDEARGLLADAQACVTQAALLAGRITGFARPAPARRAVVRLQEVLPAQRPWLALAAGRHVRLEMAVAADTWPVAIDAADLQVALVNLAANARAAMPTGGRLRVAARNLPAGDHVAITVEDSGVGMAPEVLARAAEPFFTTRAALGGSGLGLSGVRDFAHAAGGALRIDSAPGAGTTVEIVLPRADG